MSVIQSCLKVVQLAQLVKINRDKLQLYAQKLVKENRHIYKKFDEYNFHLNQQLGDENLLIYLFVLDSMNFCFWPEEGFEYENLAQLIKDKLINNPQYFQPEQFAKLEFNQFKEDLFGGKDFALIEERFKFLKDGAQVILSDYDGKIENLINTANQSALILLKILTTKFIGFQDHSVYKGKQTYYYKRAQIFIADIYASFDGKGLGQFYDIDQITMFPDYRVPQVFNNYGILEYEQNLQQKINQKQEILPGSHEEQEIRASTIIAVEYLKEEFLKLDVKLTSIECDWILWQVGEETKDDLIPYHRTLTVYY
ncbi:hypothetical protein pb186bvf_016214 [Paramecium bursaria]